MTIPVHSNEKYRRLDISVSKIFEHKPPRFWGVRLSHGSTNTYSNRMRLYNAGVYYCGTELFDIFVYEDDDFYSTFSEQLKTRNVEPTQQTIKLAEELVKFSFKILVNQPNFGAHMGLLYDKLYRAGVDNGREALQAEIKRLLDMKS